MGDPNSDTVYWDETDPFNQQLLSVWSVQATQLRWGVNGPVGLDLNVLPMLLRQHRIDDPDRELWLTQDLLGLAEGYLAEDN